MNQKVDFIQNELKESSRVMQDMINHTLDVIIDASDSIIETFRNGGKILLCGNGGSAADCQHIAAELVCRFKLERKGMPAIALTTDSSIMTAVSNDRDYEEIFRRQVEALGSSGDILIGISTSGRSRNVLLAMEQAKSLGMRTIAFTGSEPGKMAETADIVVSIPSTDVPKIQEGHIVAAHILCGLVEKILFENEDK